MKTEARAVIEFHQEFMREMIKFQQTKREQVLTKARTTNVLGAAFFLVFQLID